MFCIYCKWFLSAVNGFDDPPCMWKINVSELFSGVPSAQLACYGGCLPGGVVGLGLFDQHIFAKCPNLLHLWHLASLLCLIWFPPPQRVQTPVWFLSLGFTFITCMLLVLFNCVACASITSILCVISTVLFKVRYALINKCFCVVSWRIPQMRQSLKVCPK